MWLLVILYVAVLLVLISIGLVTYARWNFGSLEKLGIPVVPKRDFLLGSALLTYEKPGGEVDVEHMRTYGTIFGIYNGREPQIVISDPELIRLITNKDSDHFDGKRPIEFGHPLFNEISEFLPLEKWRFIRSITAPVLGSSVCIKNANPPMTEAILDFVSGLKEQIKNSENGRLDKFCFNEGIFGMLTDLLARSQFSIDIGKSDVNNQFVQLVRTIMTNPAAEAPWLASYVYAFPFLHKFLPNTMITPEPCNDYVKIIRQLVDIRRKSQGNSLRQRKDFLDYIVEWHDNLDTSEYKKMRIIEETIASIALVMFIGGQDQVSLILGAMFYHLSKNPEMEKRLQAEVDKVFSSKGDDGKLEHEDLSGFTYLTACINEAIRLYPFFFRTERVCTKDWGNEERGLKIRKGSTVIISIWGTNRNPEYFEDADEFKPERFMPGKKEKMHAYAFSSFGFGPRNCPGKRLSMEILLLLSAYLIKDFRFIKRNDSQIKFVPAGPFFGAHESIYFDAELRKKCEE